MIVQQTITEKIKQRRYQMIVHSYIYYELNDNIVSDAKWSEWAQELVQLQKDYIDESKQAPFYDEFKDFDGSTGFNLPKDAWVDEIAQRLLKPKSHSKPQPKKRNGTLNLF